MINRLDFSFAVQRTGRTFKGGQQVFLVVGGAGHILLAVSLVLLSPISGTGDNPSAASLRVSIVFYGCSWDLADAQMYRNVLLNV